MVDVDQTCRSGRPVRADLAAGWAMRALPGPPLSRLMSLVSRDQPP